MLISKKFNKLDILIMSNDTIRTKKREESTWKKFVSAAMAIGVLVLTIIGKKGNNNA